MGESHKPHGALRASMLARVLFSSRQGGVIRGHPGSVRRGRAWEHVFCAESGEAVPGHHVSARARATACARR